MLANLNLMPSGKGGHDSFRSHITGLGPGGNRVEYRISNIEQAVLKWEVWEEGTRACPEGECRLKVDIRNYDEAFDLAASPALGSKPLGQRFRIAMWFPTLEGGTLPTPICAP